jgi:hypothetical protein
MLNGEEKMWRAVIDMAISDALSGRISKSDRRKAFDWIYNGGSYFELACDMANVSPESVRRKFLTERIRKQSN